MTTTELHGSETSGDANAGMVDMKLEVVIVPVTDVDRAKTFYRSLGWRLDGDFAFENGFRVVQLTPPGSGCSVQFGSHMTAAAPGGSPDRYLVVSDIEAAHAELVALGVEVSEVFHPVSPGAQFQQDPADGNAPGVSPENRSYGSFMSFRDPDKNRWLVQEVTTRLPGRVDSSTTTYSSAADLASAMRRASAAHGEHEKRMGGPDANWPDWYASYMVAEQAGAEAPR